MFLHSKASLPLSEACMQSLSASLNAPVVQTEELAPGPARAAIVIYAEEYGDLRLAVGLRSLENGDVALYTYRDSIQSADEIPPAMEEALGFAEGLGFLFDDDMIDRETGAGRHEALEHWNRLMGKGEVFASSGVVGPPTPAGADDGLDSHDALLAPMEDLLRSVEEPGLGTDDGLVDSRVGDSPLQESELLLDDLMDFSGPDADEELSLDAGHESSIASQSPRDDPSGLTGAWVDTSKDLAENPAVPAQPVVPGVSLSKFRRVDGLAPVDGAEGRSAAGDPGGRALGRIPIVKVRAGGADASKPGLLTRILSSF
jgi:hypothetical protein